MGRMSHLPGYSGEGCIKSSGSGPLCDLSQDAQNGVDCDAIECDRN